MVEKIRLEDSIRTKTADSQVPRLSRQIALCQIILLTYLGVADGVQSYSGNCWQGNSYGSTWLRYRQTAGRSEAQMVRRF